MFTFKSRLEFVARITFCLDFWILGIVLQIILTYTQWFDFLFSARILFVDFLSISASNLNLKDKKGTAKLRNILHICYIINIEHVNNEIYVSIFIEN